MSEACSVAVSKGYPHVEGPDSGADPQLPYQCHLGLLHRGAPGAEANVLAYPSVGLPAAWQICERIHNRLNEALWGTDGTFGHFPSPYELAEEMIRATGKEE